MLVDTAAVGVTIPAEQMAAGIGCDAAQHGDEATVRLLIETGGEDLLLLLRLLACQLCTRLLPKVMWKLCGFCLGPEDSEAAFPY